MPSISIDFSPITQADLSNPFDAMWRLFASGGWIPLLIFALIGGWRLWVYTRQNKYAATLKYVLLAIDVPKLNEQSPKAVEQIFSHLTGIQKSGNWVERNIRGYFQANISLELVSIGGYIQYLFRVPTPQRDLVESAIYAQYPDAEISEVPDYVAAPSEDLWTTHDMWGTEIALTNKQVYPIRTYPQFEHPLTQKFLDPLGSMLEFMSRIRTGEQLWLQINISPADDGWRKEGVAIIRKLAGIKSKEKGNPYLEAPGKIAFGVYETLVKSLYDVSGGEAKKDNGMPSMLQHLPPHERAVIEGIGLKISKIGWNVKMRFIYFADKDVFDGTRVGAFIGSLKQYNTLDMNGFKVDKNTKTKVDYWAVESRTKTRKRRIYRNYWWRSQSRGQVKFVLNVEELASIFHFPVTETVKAPQVGKTESKKGEPPIQLPVFDLPTTPEA